MRDDSHMLISMSPRYFPPRRRWCRWADVDATSLPSTISPPCLLIRVAITFDTPLFRCTIRRHYSRCRRFWCRRWCWSLLPLMIDDVRWRRRLIFRVVSLPHDNAYATSRPPRRLRVCRYAAEMLTMLLPHYVCRRSCYDADLRSISTPIQRATPTRRKARVP